MSCWGCDSAKAHPKSGYFASDCDECSARSLAQSPSFHDSLQSESMTPAYRSALRYIFGERWIEGHAKAKQWAERLKG